MNFPDERVESVFNDPAARRAARLVLFTAFWLYTALLTLPFTYSLPGAGLDGSHAFGSNYFREEGFRYGSDLVFPFGPLGYVIYPESVSNHVSVVNLIRGGVWLVLLIHLVLFYRFGTAGFLKALLLMTAIIGARSLLMESFDYYGLTVLLVLILYLIEKPPAWFTTTVAVFLTGLLSQMKFNTYVTAMVCVMVVPATQGFAWFSSPKRTRFRDLFLVVGAFFAMPVAFFFHNPSLRGLFSYAYGGLNLSIGYSEAMSVSTTAADAFYGAVLGILLIAGVFYAAAKRAITLTLAAVFLVLCWLNFKHGFVRSDAHTLITYCFVIVLAAVLICLLRQGSRTVVPYVAAFPFFVITALSGVNLYVTNVWTEAYWSSAPVRLRVSELLDWDATLKRIEEEKKKADPFQQLPEAFRNKLDNSTATIFPWEISYARSGHFKAQPLYTMQSYSAYTEYLDRQTAQRIRDHRSEVDYIVLDWQSIDDRHPLLDVPATWGAIAENYEVDSAALGRLLLKKRSAPSVHKQRDSQTIALPIGKWVDLPASESEYWGMIRIPYSVKGGLRKTLYKANPVYLTLKSRSRTIRSRVVPGVLTSPFPISAFPGDLESLAELLSGRAGSPIIQLRIDTDFPGDYGEPSLELREETDSRLTWTNKLDKSFEAEFHTATPSAVSRVAMGSIDLINETRNPRTIPDEKNPLQIDANSGLVIAGWLSDSKEGRSFDEIYAVVNGKMLRATTMARPDVGAFFKNTALDYCGYNIEIDPQQVAKGTQRVDLIGVMNPGRVVFRFSTPVFAHFN